MSANAMPANSLSVNDEKSSDFQQYLTFAVAGEEYGLRIMAIREIRGWADATRLPNRPDYMRGVINLRGVIIPIFDLRCRFGQGVTEANDKHVVIILAVEDWTLGVLVDAVSDIIDARDSDIRPAPRQDEQGDAQYFVSGLIALENRMVVLLDIARLFGREEVRQAVGEEAAHAHA
jgi:purine-binding chemotaxis protein CheW